jgi:hypothetical protein
VQGPGWLAFQNEMIHETRVIPTDGRKNAGAAIKNWMGNSVGHWEGDVLVVETRNIKPEAAVNGQPLSDEGVLIERFTPGGRQHARLPDDDQRPEDLRGAVHRAAADSARGELRLLRVRLPRGQLRDEEPALGLARRRKAAAPRRWRAARRSPSTRNRQAAGVAARVAAPLPPPAVAATSPQGFARHLSRPNLLRTILDCHRRLFILTGAGCSTASGIPDYRDDNGDWKRARPVMLQRFLADEYTRKRYWARSLVGWQRMHAARPTTRTGRSRPWDTQDASNSSTPRTSTGCTRPPAAPT